MSLHRLLLAVVAGSLGAVTVTAQSRPPLGARLDAPTLALVRAIIDSARSDSIPARALEDKALEGAAKQVPPPRIVAAVRQLAAQLREARALLRGAAPASLLAEGEIVAAADALGRGVPASDLVALRRQVPPATPLMVGFTVLGDLVQRGVAAGQAREVIEQLITAGIPGQQVAQIPERMDVGLRVGAPPLDALRSALPIPLRPFGRPGPPKPIPDGGEYSA